VAVRKTESSLGWEIGKIRKLQDGCDLVKDRADRAIERGDEEDGGENQDGERRSRIVSEREEERKEAAEDLPEHALPVRPIIVILERKKIDWIMVEKNMEEFRKILCGIRLRVRNWENI
jgi:hypothetical protein